MVPSVLVLRQVLEMAATSVASRCMGLQLALASQAEQGQQEEVCEASR